MARHVISTPKTPRPSPPASSLGTCLPRLGHPAAELQNTSRVGSPVCFDLAQCDFLVISIVPSFPISGHAIQHYDEGQKQTSILRLPRRRATCRRSARKKNPKLHNYVHRRRSICADIDDPHENHQQTLPHVFAKTPEPVFS